MLERRLASATHLTMCSEVEPLASNLKSFTAPLGLLSASCARTFAGDEFAKKHFILGDFFVVDSGSKVGATCVSHRPTW